MNYALLLAGGVGQRMGTAGLPKQFLEIHGKPIIAHTISKFEAVPNVDKTVIVCHNDWISHINQIISKYSFTKIASVVPGGEDRMGSLKKGLNAIKQFNDCENGVVVIHDAVRPLVEEATIERNIEVASLYGNAMTVKAVTETVVISDGESATFKDFQQRSKTYSLTSPQTFKRLDLEHALSEIENINTTAEMPLLDPSLIYAKLGKKVYLVIEENMNIKVTTPTDFYYLRSILELEESKHILGI